MVVFTCGYCGESVTKPKVEKHYLTKCRNRSPNLSCMDCFKDFLGQDYDAHTKCITEEERYSGKGFTPKEKKGERKQNAWVEMVQSVLDEQKDAPRNVLRIIETISKHNNTPRKKPKFINFVKNVCGHKTNPKDMEQAWEIISVKLAELASLNEQNKNQNQKSEVNNTNGSVNGNEKQNGDLENGPQKQNGDLENGTENQNGDSENDTEKEKNDKSEEAITNGEEKPEEKVKNGDDGNTDKKLTKKQRKEEKKRKKYEAELQKAEASPVETSEIENHGNKKGKKNKNRTDSVNTNDEENLPVEGKNKNKKRKRQDTVTAALEATENIIENIENEPINKEKAQKKKLKVDGDESVCLHDQNVAKSEEVVTKGDKFNWHAVIMSVLEKKGNEVPFKRLQKKVLAEYVEATGNDVDDRIADKFIKKLKSAPNVRVDKNRVLLVGNDD